MTDRKKVLWFGQGPSPAELREFSNRGLIIHSSTDDPVDADFAVSRGIVIVFDPKAKGFSNGRIDRLVNPAIDHGLLVLLVGSAEEVLHIQSRPVVRALVEPPERSSLDPDLEKIFRERRNKPMIKSSPFDHELAELIARHEPGLPFNSHLTFRGTTCSKEQELLVRRAFSGYESVSVHRLSGGKSNSEVFLIHAQGPMDADAGPYPLPFFAKIDDWERIKREWDRFERFAKYYVPFGHRPNLELPGCILGSNIGLIVGNFVENAVPLSKVVRQTGSRQIIHSLFDDALAGWRHQSFADKGTVSIARTPTIDPPKSAFFASIFKFQSVPARHLQVAKTFGRVVEPKELDQMIKSAKHEFRSGPVHGDLNAENVFVRNNEAILIDFYKTEKGPLAADLACLEIGICFSLEAVEAQKALSPKVKSLKAVSRGDRFQEWKCNIDHLFKGSKDTFSVVPPPSTLPCSHAWMWSVCRQLRLMAHYLDGSASSYAFLLGVYLLRFSTFEESKDPGLADQCVKGYAYFIGQELVARYSAGKTSP